MTELSKEELKQVIGINDIGIYEVGNFKVTVRYDNDYFNVLWGNLPKKYPSIVLYQTGFPDLDSINNNNYGWKALMDYVDAKKGLKIASVMHARLKGFTDIEPDEFWKLPESDKDQLVKSLEEKGDYVIDWLSKHNCDIDHGWYTLGFENHWYYDIVGFIVGRTTTELEKFVNDVNYILNTKFYQYSTSYDDGMLQYSLRGLTSKELGQNILKTFETCISEKRLHNETRNRKDKIKIS